MPYQSSNPPVSEIRILSIQGCMRQTSRSACFLMGLNGEVQVRRGEHPVYLNRDDILLVEPGVTFELTGHGNNLLILIRMDYDFFAQGRSFRSGSLVCNSAEDEQRDYSLLRHLLSHLAMVYFEESDCKDLRQLELCYALLYHLNTSHYTASGGARENAAGSEGRDWQIISYIENNYMHEIQLEDLSRATYLSASYLSRMFKKIAGMNFKAYLEEVRLRHATEDLRRPEQTITAIAYSNGFPNVSALGTAIRKKYGMSPNEYRRTLAEAEPETVESAPYQELDYASVRNTIADMAGPEPPRALGMYRFPDQMEYCVADMSRFTPVKPIWKTMINIGTLNGLLNVNARAQLSLLQDEIGFRYARVESVLTDESIPALRDGSYNFSYFDRAMELLLSLKLTPFLDLSFKGDLTLLSRSEQLYRGDRPRAQSTEQEFLEKTAALLRHCINTFGSGEVETWCVEICVLHDEHMHMTEQPSEYSRRFAAAFRMIKQWLPGMLVGGPELHIAMDEAFLVEAAEHMKREDLHPDFLSLCAIPYTPTQPGSSDIPLMISPDPDYIRDRVSRLRDTVEAVMRERVPVWITVLGPDIRTRNHLNDSCYQATFFVKNTIDLIGLADVVGYWQLSDIDNEYTDTTRLLFGGTGILSKDGLKKPGFTALKRLARLSTQLIEKTGNLLVTTNGVNTYNVVLYNYSHFNDAYCLSTGEGIDPDSVYTVFRDSATRDIAITLNGLPRGRYRIIAVTLNREHGCLFDEWMRYGLLDNMQPHDIRYLRDIVHPHRAVQYYDCSDGTLELTTQMLPHEVKFLTILLEL